MGRQFQVGGYEIYASGLGTLAMAEAYGMTKDERLKPAARRRGLRPQEAEPLRRLADSCLYTSVTGWMVMALKSAKIAGLKVDSVGFQGATKWLDDVTDRHRSGRLRSPEHILMSTVWP